MPVTPLSPMKPQLLLLAALGFFARAVPAAEPFLKPNDVIALVGGEDMVAASEYGYLELLLQQALPDYHLKFRSLAWEGDTVFEQPRELNYPSLEQQLDDIGATVVIMQFGQMESLAGTSKLPEFIKAYEKLIERVKAGGKRRVIGLSPTRPSSLQASNVQVESTFQYIDASSQLHFDAPCIRLDLISANHLRTDRDGLHLSNEGLALTAFSIGKSLGLNPSSFFNPVVEDKDPLLTLIQSKNRYWFHYTRPQNWAFLNGDRTNQPSSRDHKDPSKRWFPEEMKQWLPLIDAKEKEIWELARKSSSPAR